MSSNFKITNAGNAAIGVASPLGPFIYLDHFKIGSGVNYTTSEADTALHGTILYSGLISNYQVVAADTTQLTLTMNEAIGDFDFGEIGIYTNDGTLFALYSYTALQQKRASVGTVVGNRFIINAKLQRTMLSALLLFPVINPGTGLPQIPRFSTLQPTMPDANAYSVLWGDGYGNPGIAIRDTGTNLWGFPTHVTHFDGAVVSGTLSTVVNTDQILLNLVGVAQGRYILQFVDGIYQGYVREVTGFDPVTGTLTFFPMLPTAPGVGDHFRVNVSNAYWLQIGNGVLWAGAKDYNDLATRINAITGTPNYAVSPNNKGYNSGSIALLPVPQQPLIGDWTILYDAVRKARKHQGATPSAIDALLLTQSYFYQNINPLGQGLESFAVAFDVLAQAVTDMETNKDQRAIATLLPIEPTDGAAKRQTAWTGSISQSVLLTFTDVNHICGWFNSGCRIGHHSYFGHPIDIDDNKWAQALAAAGFNKISHTTTIRNEQTLASDNGFFDLVIGGPTLVLATQTVADKTFNFKASRPTANTLNLMAEYIGGDDAGLGPIVVGGAAGPGSGGSAVYGIFSQFTLERHNSTYLSAIALPTTAYTLNGMVVGGPGTEPFVIGPGPVVGTGGFVYGAGAPGVSAPPPAPAPAPTGFPYFTLTPGTVSVNRTVGVSQSATVSVGTNGTPTSILPSVGALPPGLTLAISGNNLVLLGIPAPGSAGTYTYGAWIVNSNPNPFVIGGQPANATGFSITVVVGTGTSYMYMAPNPSNAVAPANGSVTGIGVSTVLNGVPSTITLISGTPPPGVSFVVSGQAIVASGTPTTPGSYSATYRVNGTNLDPATPTGVVWVLNATIGPPVSVAPYFAVTPAATVAVANVGQDVSIYGVGTGINGTITGLTLVSGSLPPGVGLVISGANIMATGAPTTAGSYTANYLVQGSNLDPTQPAGFPWSLSATIS